MSPLELSLKSTLDEHPSDWAVRFLVIDKVLERGAEDEARALIVSAPLPPNTNEELHRIVELAGVDAHDLIASYVLQHPANGYGHHVLGAILDERGEQDKANQHFMVAESLGTSLGELPEHSGEEGKPEEHAHVHTPVPPEAEGYISPSLSALVQEGEIQQDIQLDYQEMAPPPQRGKKATAILVALAVHIVIAIIAALVVILPGMKEEPEIVAIVAPSVKKKQEMQKKNVVKQTKRTTASSAAAAPLAQLMRANAIAKISLPNVTRTSKGPLGIGDADFGAGGFGGGGSGMGSGETMFGSQSGSGLIGSFYDLKQNRKREGTGINGSNAGKFNEVMQKAARAKFAPSAFTGFFKAPMELRFGILAIPTMDANEGPAAFAVEKEVQPKAWLVHYKGKVAPPERGKWRFVGVFDDALIVFVNGKVVLDASWGVCFQDEGVRQPFGGPALANGKPPIFGNWVDLQGPFQIDILVGERPGGSMGGALMIQKEGGRYKKRKDGTPILPIFSTGKLDGTTLKRLRDYPYEFAKDEAIFRTVTGGF